ncbi:MAG: YitT family protein [Bacilli bacterium]|nr:YitT family protein [Bacilli bacterium]
MKLYRKDFETGLQIFILTLGAFLAALALELFLIPNTILDGGVTGIAILLHKIFHFPLSLLVIVLNIPFLFIGFKSLGKRFLFRTIYSMLCFALFIFFFEHIDPITEEILLATVFGGALLGIGVGLIIHFGGCIDGTESVAIVLNKKLHMSVGQIVLIFNLFIYTTAGFVFGLDRAMYSLLTYFITFKVIDFVSTGLEQAKAALIITEKGTNLSEIIYQRLGRTTTSIKGEGLISGEKEVLYCVLTRLEIYELKHIVEEMDKSAFITIIDVTDIIGNHIKSTENRKGRKKSCNES